MVSLPKAKWRQALPANVRLHLQPSLELILEIASQFGPGKQPKFAAASEQSSTVVQPCSMLQPNGGYQKAVTGSTHTQGPNHTPINSNSIDI